ncbi:MAG: F0F1 ATP synthase subunit epsilon [Desulfosudaceae bacterium]
MAKTIQLSIVTPEKNVVSGDASIVMAPGTVGEFGVLVDHTPFLTSLQTGTVRYTAADGREERVFVSGGFAEALPDRVTILAESAEKKEEIDIQRAEAAKARAEKRLAESNRDDVDEARARAALTRSIQRLNCCSG